MKQFMGARAERAVEKSVEQDDRAVRVGLERDIHASTHYRSRIDCRELLWKALAEFRVVFGHSTEAVKNGKHPR